MLPDWKDLPNEMKNDTVKKYYSSLKRKEDSLMVKRVFDIWMSAFMLIILAPVMAVIGIMIKLDSRGPVLFTQARVTAGNKDFIIYKFRSMVKDAPELGSAVTVSGDMRITKMGAFMRKYRIDELPQLINVLKGEMTFVGTRPEVRKYVNEYTPQMMATLLLPAGITSEASIMYKEEDELLASAENADDIYINQILPEKMRYNLRSLRKFSVVRDVVTMIRTVLAVL